MRLLTSLRSAFSLYFVAAAVIPLLIFGVLADDYLTDLHISQIERELSLHTLDVRRQVDALLREVPDDLEFIGLACDRMLADDPRGVDGFLQDAVNSKPYYQSLYLIDQQRRVRHLGLAGKLSGQKEDYLGLDLSGHELLAGNKGPEHALPSRVRWSEVFVSEVTGEPSISLGIPLRHGTLLGTISLRRLGMVLESRIVQRGSIEFGIVDRHGTLVAHSRSELVLQRTNLLLLHPELKDALTSGREVEVKLHEDDSLLESVQLTAKPVWAIHGSLQREAALASLRHVRLLLVVALGGALLVSISLAVWLARRISRPLLRLHDTAGALARGNYERGVAFSRARFSEVDDLAASFQHMAEMVRVREASLRDNEGRFRAVVAGMGEGLIVYGDNGTVIDCNAAAETILGMDRTAILNLGMNTSGSTLIHWDGTELTPEEFPVAFTLKTGLDVDKQLLGIRRVDGREIWLQVNTRLLPATVAEAGGMLLTFADVTTMKLAELTLLRSKERFQELFQQFRTLLDGITDRIDLIGPDLRVVWSNQGAGADSFGGFGSYQGLCCHEVWFNRTEPCSACPVVQCFASGRAEVGEIQYPQGQTWSVRAFPVFDEQDWVKNVVMISSDITEKIEADRHRNRAGQLAALGELAAGVAHEINNPISGVINYAQLICNRTEEGAREHDLARRIIKEGDRIATIVRELLTFAREETTDIQVVSIREALAEALSLCESQLRKEGVDLRIDLPADLPRVESRSHQIQQLFLNLISNARHALSDKYPEPHSNKILRINGSQVETGGRPGVRIKIMDHGTGIPAEMLERVMNPFVTTKPAGVGTGLGLSISFEIAKKHGGLLTIASRYGDWTEVTVDLPACIKRGEQSGQRHDES